MEPFFQDLIDHFVRAGEKKPIARIDVVRISVSGKDRGGIIIGIHGKGNQFYLSWKFFLELSHLMRQEGTFIRTTGINEIRNPDLTAQGFTRERLSMLIC